jgi:hypothetical protein
VFDTTVQGQYTFIFSNLESSALRTATLAIHTFQEIMEPIQYDINDSGERVVKYDPNMDTVVSEDFVEELDLAGDKEIGNVRNILRGIQTVTKQIQTESVMSLNRQDGHNADSIKNGNWYFWAMLIELLLFLAILIFQMQHMKSKLDNKLLL